MLRRSRTRLLSPAVLLLCFIAPTPALPCADRPHSKAFLDALRKEINKAVQKSPELRESLWTKVAERFGIDEPPGAKRRQGE